MSIASGTQNEDQDVFFLHQIHGLEWALLVLHHIGRLFVQYDVGEHRRHTLYTQRHLLQPQHVNDHRSLRTGWRIYVQALCHHDQ